MPDTKIGNKTYRDFTPQQLTQIKGAMAKLDAAVVKARAALAKAQPTLGEKTDLEDRVKTWFGPGAWSTAGVAVLSQTIGRMNHALSQGGMLVMYYPDNVPMTAFGFTQPACDANTNAAALPSPGLVTLQQARTKSQINFYLFICKRLLQKMGMLGTGQQSMVNTLAHELSHAVIGTSDVVLNNQECYGPDLAKALAINPTGAERSTSDKSAATAFDNAENYGFFVASFV